MSNAREIAMKVIYDVEFNGAYSNMALKKALKTDMPKQDKAFISNLVYGVTDRKLLPHFIGQDGIFFAEIAAWSGATVILCISYYVRMHKYH